jgi:tellurite resistance protein TehA-like permease
VLAVWVGGLVVLGGIAAPTLFGVLEARDPSGGTTLAAVLFGAVFRRFQQIGWMLGGALILLLIVRAALGPRPRRLAVRIWTVAAMVGMSLAGALYLAPRIDAIRSATPGLVKQLPDGDESKAEFGRLHGTSTILMLLTLAAGAGLLWLEMKDAP